MYNVHLLDYKKLEIQKGFLWSHRKPPHWREGDVDIEHHRSLTLAPLRLLARRGMTSSIQAILKALGI